MAFTEPFSDCSMLPNKIGSENAARARGIDPSVNEYLGGMRASIEHPQACQDRGLRSF
jgi:hypothetical protein